MGSGLRRASVVCAVVVSAGTAGATPEFVNHVRLFEVTQPGGLVRSVPAVEMSRTAAEFYDYRSASSHTGFERARRSLLFLHRDLRDDRLSLVITHGIDGMGQPAAERQPTARVDFDLEGVPPGAVVAAADDDAGELQLGRDPEGRWDFADNTDGGVIAGLPIDADWAITIAAQFITGIDAWAYHFADGTSVELDLAQPVTIRSRGASVRDGEIRSDEGTPITLCVLATDARADVDLLFYAIDWADGSVPTRDTAPPGTLHCAEHTYADDARYAIRVTAGNAFNEEAAKEVPALIANVVPTVAAGGPYDGDEGEAVLLRASLVADPGAGDTHRVRWDFDADGVWDTALDDALAVEHRFPNDGVHRVRVEMRDDDDGAGTAETVVTVRNLPPAFTSAPPLTVHVGHTWSYAPTAADPGGDPVTFAVLDAPAGVALEDGVVRWTPAAVDVGEHAFQLVALDDADGAAAQDVTITVLPNEPPTPAIEPAQPDVGEGDRLVVDSSSTLDPEGDALTFAWACEGGLPIEADGARLAVDAAALDGPAEPAAFPCRLTVDDGTNAPVVVPFTVRVHNVTPVVEAVEVVGAAEGAPAVVRFLAGDAAAADTFTYGVDCDDDGTLDVIDADTPDLTCTFADSGEHTVTVVVTDDDGASGSARSLPFVVANRPPVIEAPDCPPAIEGIPLALPVHVSDPAGARDTVRCSLADPVPEGVDVDADLCDVRWVPTYAQAVAGSVVFEFRAADEDGGTAALRLACPVRYLDEDGDGLPDTWAGDHGLAGGCDDDPDGDGRTNCEEFDGGTDPNAFEGPEAPVPVAPADGAVVDTATPSLVVRGGDDPFGRPLSYEYTVSADADGARTVVTSDLVPETPDETAWTLPAATLEEGATYWWSARAHAGRAFGPPSARVAFTVDAVDEAPSTPTIRRPEDGDRVAERAPSLVVDGAVDPDPDDALRYACEVATDAAFADVVRAPAGAGTPATLPIEPELDENTRYFARCRAVDAAGNTSDWSAVVGFTIDTGNDAPSAPTIIAPEHRAVVGTPEVTLVAGAADDPDGDPLTYAFWVSDDPTFPPARTRASDELPAADDGRVTWTVPDALPDETLWFWRVRARDADAAGPFATARFRVDLGNAAPSAPVPLEPAAGATAGAAPRFVWQAATDPEGEALTYRVELFAAGEAAPIWSTETGELTAGHPGGLSPGPHAWRVRATDASGAASGWSADTPFAVAGPADAGLDPDAGAAADAMPDAAADAASDAAADAASDATSDPLSGTGDAAGAAADGCDCDAAGGAGPFPLLLLALLGVARRRR